MEKLEITKALQLLEEAAVKDAGTVKELLKDKCTSLKNALIDSEAGMAQKLAQAKQRAIEAAAHAKELAEIKAKELAGTVDESVHQNPWAYIGGAAAVGVLIGYILGRNK